MIEQIAASYHGARKRLLLLDYDGTLVSFKSRPSLARPTQEVLDVLANLARDPRNAVVVVSGRDHQSLEKWLGHLPIGLIAEHGCFVKQPGAAWHKAADTSEAWQHEARPILDSSVKAIERSFVEEKATILVWHYRQADQAQAAEEAKKLGRRLSPIAQKYGLVISPGHYIIEMRSSGINKGLAVRPWLESPNLDFILVAGDDTTDEDMFKAAPSKAFTIKVGRGKTAARVRLEDTKAFVSLLQKIQQFH